MEELGGEEEDAMRCDYSILAGFGWRKRTPQKSWEGLKRARGPRHHGHEYDCDAGESESGEEEEEEGFGWGLKKGDCRRQEREGRQGTTTGVVLVVNHLPGA